jgi:hypothetical protein
MTFDNIQDQNTNVTIHVTNARGSEIASKLTGYFIINNQKFNFKAIAFGRIGGHNISLKIAKKTLEKIKKMGLDSEVLQVTIQRKLIEGDVIIPEGIKMSKIDNSS